MGLHSGTTVVGTVGHPDRQSLQFLGFAVELEALTREHGCVALVSADTCVAAGLRPPPHAPVAAPLRGRDAALSAFPFQILGDLERWLASGERASV